MTPKFHSLEVSDVRKETDDTVSVAFHLPADLVNSYTYVPGQYLTLRATVDGEDIRRSYSICTAPYENELRVAIKKVNGGKFSTWATSSLKKGDVMEVMTPSGNFQFTADSIAKKNYVLFAAGSGITPIISIAKSILVNEPNSSVSLFYGNKGYASIIFRDEIENLKNTYMERFRLIHVLSRESLGNKIQKGRIDAEKVAHLYNAFLQNQSIDGVYVCGPESMIHAVKDQLNANGISEQNIHFELFGTAPVEKIQEEVSTTSVVTSKITIILDDDRYDLELASNGKSILEAGYDAGADLPFACKGGVCCTCKAKILEGSAKMDINYALEQDEVEAGYILTCQAHPTSDKLVVSFDD